MSNSELLQLGKEFTDYPIEHWLIMYEEPMPDKYMGTYDRLLSRHKSVESATRALKKYMYNFPAEIFKIEKD